MKMNFDIIKCFFIIFFSISIFVLNAQVQIPDASPKCKISQKVGLTTVTVEYSRPSMKNRIVFGDLIPYDKMWRTGQNEATTIDFSDDVLVNGELLPKGKYALYSIPGEDEWSIIFYRDWDHFGIPKRYVDEDEVLRVTVISDLLATTFETFLINFDNITDASMNLQLFWEDVFVEVKFEFDTDSKVEENIKKVMAGPSRSDYYLAAKYYYDHRLDMERSLEWVDMANRRGRKYWQYRLKSQILHKLGDDEGALVAAEISLEMSKKARNNKYIKFNMEFIDMLTPEMDPSIDPQPKSEELEKSISEPRPKSRDELLMEDQ